MSTLFNNQKTMKKTILLTFIAFAGLIAIPDRANACIKALGFLDPFCVVSGDAQLPLPGFNSGSDQTTNNYTNSNNITNSNVNSNVNTYNGGTPTYNYDNDYNNNSPLGVSCYSTPTSASVGDTVIWRASPYGGNGNYNISWSGTNGLSGNGTSVSKRYNSDGTKNASVTVISGNKSISRNCNNSVDIYDYDNDNYDNDYDYDDDYDSSLSVSCSADTTFAPAGSRVTWRAYVSGGNGNYRYDWDGDENLNGSSKSETIIYDNSGTKRASVEVRSGSRTVTRSCSNYVTVGTQNNYNYNANTSAFQIACYPDKTSARIGAPVTWSVEAVGGSGNYSYSWIGTNGLSGNSYSVMTTYGSAGTKSATVTVTDANGKTASQSCGSTVYVSNPSTGGTTVKPVTNGDDDSSNDYSAAALFSLKNIPWGWVIVLVFLILFGTIVYLIATRNRIK